MTVARSRSPLHLRYALGAVALALAVAAAAFLWHHHSQPYHFLTVEPGKLYRSGTLSPEDLESVLDEHSIRTVVSLRTVGEQALGDWYEHESAICRERGVDLVNLPTDEPPSAEHITQWLDLVTAAERLPILVHCKHGAVRTAVMVAIYEMEVLSKSPEATLAELPVFGHELDAPNRVHLRDFILGYVRRRAK